MTDAVGGFGELFGALGEIFGGAVEAAEGGAELTAAAALAGAGQDEYDEAGYTRYLTGGPRALNVNDL